MGEQKISARTTAITLAGTEYLPIIDGLLDLKTTVQDVADLAVATPAYDIYTAALSQSSTSAPIVTSNGTGAGTPFQNTVGAIVWTRDVLGIYLGTLANAFINADKVAIFHQSVGNDTKAIIMYVNDNDSVAIETYVSGALADDVLASTSIEIRIYP